MKSYPTIPSVVKNGVDVIAFDKLDGSNIRAEWSKKKGFYKFGSRNRLLGPDEKPLGEAIFLIKDKYEKDLENIFRKNRYENVVCFFEFFGKNSAFGQHIDEDHDVILFDVNIYKKGIMQPREFVKLFKNVETPSVLYDGRINVEFVNSVKNGSLAGMTFEGVVCKGALDRKTGMPLMFKIKSDQWLERLKNYCNGNDKLFDILK